MDAIVTSYAPQATTPPTATPDVRPTADTAALARDPQPDMPFPVPASFGQQGEINQSRIGAKDADQVAEVERVLKPYGVSMLPHDPGEGEHAQPDPEEG